MHLSEGHEGNAIEGTDDSLDRVNESYVFAHDLPHQPVA